jgi:hypothetical protein
MDILKRTCGYFVTTPELLGLILDYYATEEYFLFHFPSESTPISVFFWRQVWEKFEWRSTINGQLVFEFELARPVYWKIIIITPPKKRSATHLHRFLVLYRHIESLLITKIDLLEITDGSFQLKETSFDLTVLKRGLLAPRFLFADCELRLISVEKNTITIYENKGLSTVLQHDTFIQNSHLIPENLNLLLSFDLNSVYIWSLSLKKLIWKREIKIANVMDIISDRHNLLFIIRQNGEIHFQYEEKVLQGQNNVFSPSSILSTKGRRRHWWLIRKDKPNVISMIDHESKSVQRFSFSDNKTLCKINYRSDTVLFKITKHSHSVYLFGKIEKIDAKLKFRLRWHLLIPSDSHFYIAQVYDD